MKLFDRILKHVGDGNGAEAARKLGVTRQWFWKWEKRGIPVKYAFEIEKASKGKVTAKQVMDERVLTDLLKKPLRKGHKKTEYIPVPSPGCIIANKEWVCGPAYRGEPPKKKRTYWWQKLGIEETLD